MKSLRFIPLFLVLPLYAMAQMNYFQVPNPPGISTSGVRSNALAVDPADRVWVAFAVYGVGMWDGAAWTLYNTSNSGLPSDSATAIQVLSNGDAWIGTKLGVALKSGTNWTVYNTGNSGLPSNFVNTLFVDGNTIWIGTQSGLASYDGSSWTTYSTQNSGLLNDSVMVIRKDLNGAMWIGTRSGLSRFLNNTWTSWTNQNAPISRSVYDIECLASGKVWVASSNINVIGSFSDTRVGLMENNSVLTFEETFYHFERDFSYYASEIAIDPQGNVNFLTALPSRSIMRISGDELNTFNFNQPNIGPPVVGCRMTFDSSGKLWMMSRVGFYLGFVDPATYTPSFFSNWMHTYRESDINDMAVGINSFGDMHWDYSNPRHEVPKGSGKHSVFASNLWIGGMDSGGNLHMAAQTYRQTGFDYWPGPIDGISAPFDTASCIAFDRVWKIDRWKVEEFKDQFLAGNVTNGTYKVPEEIASWPAKGNGIVDEEMAPFVDYNGDGIYDPMTGDYPRVDSDQLLWRVFNDSLVAHTGSLGPRLGIEVRSHVNAYTCSNAPDSLSVLNRSTFYKYEIINRSTNTYSDVLIGLWVDVDLGNYMDDLIGCDSTRAAGFVYNGDNDDETNSGYGLNPPMQNVKILRGPLADPGDLVDNDLDGIVDEPGERCTMNYFMTYNNNTGTPTGIPGTALDYYNLMQSIWLDGQHLTYGGSGYDPANAPSNFIYSGVPYSGTGWTASVPGGSPPNDQRFLLTTGKFSLLPGDTAVIDFAYVFTWDPSGPNGLNTSIARNQADLDRVQYWFENNSYPSCETYTTGIQEVHSTDLKVYPNPVNDLLYLETSGMNHHNLRYSIYNALGELLDSGLVRNDRVRVSNLPPQFYILKISDGNRERSAGFIRQ